MALHISVRGQFGSSCRRPVNVLDDPARVKKDLENERRITRLQQVREKSNHLARKIREDVAAEKKRQIDRLEQTKQDELKVWREHVLVKKHQDYRSAIFQVGSAHRAAKAETERTEKRKQEKIDKMKNCRLRAMKRNAGKTNVKLRSTAGMNLNAQGRATTGTQTPLPQLPQAVEPDDKENRASGGATHNYQSNPMKSCCDDNPDCFCLTTDDEDACDDFVCESSDSSILHLDDDGEEQTRPSSPKSDATSKLKKNPTVILDVDIDDADCRVINTCTTGMDINDRYIQTNRKFSHVVRPSPRTSPERRDSPRRPRFTQITDLVKRNEITVRPVQQAPAQAPAPAEAQQVPTAPPSPTKSLPRSPRKTMPAAKLPAEAASGSRLATKRAPSAAQPPKKSSIAGTRRSTGLRTDPPPAKVIDAGITGTRRSTGLRTDPPPAKVIDAGIKRKTLPTKIGSQPSAAQPKVQAAQQPTAQGEVPSMQQQQPPMQHPSVMQQNPQMQQALSMQQHPEMQLPNVLQQAPQYPHPLQQQQAPFPPLQQQQARYPPPMQQQARYPPPLQQQQQAAFPPPHSYAPYPQAQAPYPQNAMQPYAMPFPGYPQYLPPPPPPHAVYAQQQQQAMAMPMPRPPPPVIPAAAPQRSSTATSDRSSTGTFILRQSDQQSNPVSSVHFYDHNNKYHRTYEAPVQSVQLNGPDPRLPSAMAQALDENHLRGLREQELDQLRKKCDRRGQRALEREQVRRDCAELTEKLEALSQQQPNLLPSDANFIAGHRFADLAARREHKMNEAMEEMLLRPAIVTCPEVGGNTAAARPGRSKVTAPNAINLGERPDRGAGFKGSSDSCCSMLLDYVDDQSKQLRSDLRAEDANTPKSLRLKNLLDRVEQIRTQLMEELKAGERPDSHADKDKAVLDAIRQEREDILTEKARTLNVRETELEQKEALLEQRLKKFYKEQKQKKSSDIEVNSKNGDNPVIIIKVNSDGTVKQCKPKNKSKPTGRSTAIESIPTEAAPTEPKDQRQNSIDSNSTAYRSLPPISYKNPIAPATATEGLPTPVDPLIAHYIQRLLGMTRRSMQELSASSSEVPTPDPSIINVSANISKEETVADKLRVEPAPAPAPEAETVTDRLSVEREGQTAADKLRVERVQAFIQDNRSFVDELEDTMRSQQQQQQQQDKESSMQAFDQIWNKRLANKVVSDTARPTKETAKRHKERSRERVQPRPSSSRSSSSRKSATPAAPAKRTTPPAVEKSDKQAPDQEPADLQIERYAQLTENCTHRIAELTELITKVREEKQRLVEVTLTSASDGERQSTEYFDLPPGQTQPQRDTQRQPRSRTLSERSDNTTPSTSEALPLIKHKPMGASRDSGISESRPITALGQVNVELEPPLSTQSTTQRRGRAPPATIRRYSPQLDAEDLAHELSTIAEVETPGQSHIVAATPVPKPFPNFDDYARELRLDLSHLDADQSQKLQRDFDELVQAINKRCGGLNYREFPSISAYLHNVTTTRLHVEVTDQGTVTTGELMRQLRLDSVPIEDFPDRREYMQKLLDNVPADQRELIDSASLENDSSDSFNVEKELRQRRIVRRSNGATEVITSQEVASSTRRESVPPDSTEPPNESGIDQLTGSSLSRELDRELQRIGVQWPSTRRQRQAEPASCSSSSSSSPRSHRSRLRGGQSHTSARKSTHTTSERSAQDVSQIGRSLNLREFLTRELLKHHVGLVDSSDDSLKSSFLHSIIDSHSSSRPSPSPGHGTGATNDRQKTSTPRGSFLTVQEKSGGSCLQTPQETPRLLPSGSNSQLFSGESRISLINYPDGTPPVPFGSQHQQSARATSSTDLTQISTRKSETKRKPSSKSPRK